jgi:plasmid stability protein
MAATITIRYFPSQLCKFLKKNDAINHRSINKEVISLIKKMYLSVKINPDEYLANVK